MTTPLDERLRDVDVVHLTFGPPFAQGSYSSLVGALLECSAGPRQGAISYWDGPVPTTGVGLDQTVIVGKHGGRSLGSLGIRLPERVRRHLFAGIGSRERIRYALEVRTLLAEARPRLVVVWDDYKLGTLLRHSLGDSCTLVLSQHGRSYHLAPDEARRLYSLASFDAVVTLSKASYQMERAGLYAYESLLFVRPNAVDPDRFAPTSDQKRIEARVRWGLPTDASVVLTLSRLTPAKGVHLLLHSWVRVLERVPNAYLWIVGEGHASYTEPLSRMVTNLGLGDHVRFQGGVDRGQVSDCHAAADLYVLPTLADEGHPLSLLEAMSSGLACVASDCPTVSELHGGAVDLVPDPNRQDAFVEPVTRLLLDPDARSTLGRKARAQILERFTLDTYLQDLSSFFERQLPSNRGGAR